MEELAAYLPIDRRHALAAGQNLPDRTVGAALFADISGFTPLTEALVRELGPQRGAEELTRYLNVVYDAVIDEVHRYRGSVIAFAGDAITCWFDGDDGLAAVTAAGAMQETMKQFDALATPAGATVQLAMKAAIATGAARRFLVGDPEIRILDALAGDLLARLANAEHHALKGEVVIDAATARTLAPLARFGQRRHDAARDEWFVVVEELTAPALPSPWPALAPDALGDAQVRPWLLAPVYTRLCGGLGDFLAELRPTVALFLRFGGIDYDGDPHAGIKLDRYIAWVQSVVARFDGTLIDLNIGDKGSYLYINFGAPQAHEDNAERAAAAALLLRSPPDAFRFVEPVQIGISQGRMRAGAYGGASHRTYGVLGDEVNMAARLMMAAQPGEVLVSQAAQRHIAGHFSFEALPPIRVKGKSQPVTIYALVGTRVRRAFQVAPASYQLPLIGREAELARVVQQLAHAAQGRGQIVGVAGQAGVGKSRLVGEVLNLAVVHQFAVYSGECQSYGANSSYLPWETVWRGIFGLEPTWPPERQVEALEERLTAVDPVLLPRMPLLGMVLNLAIPENALTRSLDARLRKTALEALLVDCIRAAAGQRPLLVLLEDCQWLDALSQDLLYKLGAAIADLPVLLLYVYRPLGEARRGMAWSEGLAHHTEIVLAPLDREEADRFVRAKVTQLTGRDSAIPDALVARVTARAEGNPFYLEELLNYLHNQGVDLHDAGMADEIALPDSLQRLVLSVVDQLSENQKITVKVASVIGRVFRAAWLWGVYPQLGDAARIRRDLETLRQRELLLMEPGDAELTYLFRQIITQGVTYESLPFAVKETLHGQIGEFLEQAYAGVLEQVLDFLAYHFDRSDRVAKRRLYLRRAGEAAQAEYSNAAAIDYYQRLLPLLQEPDQVAEQLPVLLRLGQVLELIGHWDEAGDRYQQALTLAEALGDAEVRSQAQIAIGEIHRKQGRFAEAGTWYARAQGVAEDHGDLAGVAKALICAGTLAAQQGDYGAATERYAQSLAIRRALGDRPNIANVLNNLGIVSQFRGEYGASRAFHEEALAIRRSLGDQWAIAISLNNLGTTALDQADYAQAGAYLEEALRIQRTIGDKWAIANALNNLANVRRELGLYADAHALYAESITLNRALGEQRGLAYLLEDMGMLAAMQGQAARALRLAGAAAAARAAIQSPLAPAEQENLDRKLAPAQAALGQAAAAEAWTAGTTLGPAEAIALALQA